MFNKVTYIAWKWQFSDVFECLWRLQEYCEKLLFYCPLEYGRKAEELLWRKAFYEIIQLMKHSRKVFVFICCSL